MIGLHECVLYVGVRSDEMLILPGLIDHFDGSGIVRIM